jgi:hypothetical protein
MVGELSLGQKALPRSEWDSLFEVKLLQVAQVMCAAIGQARLLHETGVERLQ